ncbi:MAG TPA: sialidase, partial [Sphingomicrobium sp.]|nr:sialidase [Sphingomicrobium sp.]
MLRSILLASAALAIAPASAQSFDSAAVSGLGVRNIGSATMSGRIAAIAGRQEPDGKVTLLIGSASGGVWKSEDGGTTFKPVFDKEPVKSIGAVALDPTNKQVMWVGTGESWTRNSVSVGDGVYKSTDGGETWTHMGLPATERISRIVVNPKDGNIVYVCAPGALWSDSPDRGLYKTTDGGKSWSLILKGANLSTGCSSVAMDPSNPEHLFAGTWDFRRKAYEFRSGGNGP